ncbi:MAG: ABC transporter permease, partial [Patescibacteria group bacterium]
MKLTEVFEESVSVLKVNGMRTALSALGIIIGIGSVITLMTLGQASQQSVKSRIQSLGSNL